MGGYVANCITCNISFVHCSGGLRRYCSKACQRKKRNERAAARHRLSPEEIAAAKAHEQDKLEKSFIQPEAIRKRKLQTLQRWKKKNPLAYMVNKSRARAKKDGIEFTISEDDIIIPEGMICPILGLQLDFTVGRGYSLPNSASLDRIDNSLGYVKGNVCLISLQANRMKNGMTRDHLTKIIEYMDTYSHK